MSEAKRPGPRIDSDVEQAVRAAFYRGYSVREVRDELTKQGHAVPSQGWLYAKAQEWGPPRKDEPSWTWRSVPFRGVRMEDLLFLQQAYAYVLAFSGGRIDRLTQAHAEWVARIHQAFPMVPPSVTYHFAGYYASAQPLDNEGEVMPEDKADVARPDFQHLDVSLAFAANVVNASGIIAGLPVMSVEAHVALHLRKWRDKPLIAWAGVQETQDAYQSAIVDVGGYWMPIVIDAPSCLVRFDV